jgi:adenylyltransferase/sulfurtransferase
MNLDGMTEEIYSRQIMLKEIGEQGQKTLANASVFVAGCGGLGSPALMYLTAMGIGRLGICDGDAVSYSNMNRQFLYSMGDIGKPKARMAEKRLLALNPRLKTDVYERYMDDELARSAIPEYDIAVDCLDNYKSRFILNDACVAAGKPYVHAGIGEYYGQLLTVTPGVGPCLRCLFPVEKPDEAKESRLGVIGATAGVLGSMQVMEVFKYLLGLQVCNKKLAVYDGLNMNWELIAVEAAPGCGCNSGGHNG